MGKLGDFDVAVGREFWQAEGMIQTQENWAILMCMRVWSFGKLKGVWQLTQLESGSRED